MRSAASGIGAGSTLPKLPAPTIRVAQSRVKSKEENVMNVLAIGRYASCAFDAYVPAEKQRVTELREEGFISDLFFKTTRADPFSSSATPTATRRGGALRPCRWSKRDFWPSSS